MFHLVVLEGDCKSSIHYTATHDVLTSSCHETQNEAEKKAKEIVKEVKQEYQRQMNRANEGRVKDKYHFYYFVFDLNSEVKFFLNFYIRNKGANTRNIPTGSVSPLHTCIQIDSVIHVQHVKTNEQIKKDSYLPYFLILRSIIQQ